MMPIEEAEIQRRVAFLCDEETTADERPALERSVRLGAALQDAHEIAQNLVTTIKQLHHDFWDTPAEYPVLRLYWDSRQPCENINGWDDTEDEDGSESTTADGRGGPGADKARPLRHRSAPKQPQGVGVWNLDPVDPLRDLARDRNFAEDLMRQGERRIKSRMTSKRIQRARRLRSEFGDVVMSGAPEADPP
jgi:hypothetical protein